MSTLPYQGRCAFASLHPAVTLGFFAGAIVLSMVLALTQLGEHIFQRHRSELVEADATDHGIHHL